MSKKIVLCIILILFIYCSSVFGKGPYIKRISKDLKTAVIMEDDSGVEREIKKGDQINEWIIIDIKPGIVVLRQKPKDDVLIEEQMILRVPSTRDSNEQDISEPKER